MMFANARRAIPCLGQQHRQCFHPRKTTELVVAVQVPVMAVAMIVQAGKHHAAACAATGCGGKGIPEESAVGRQPVNIRRHRRHLPITPHRGAEIIGDDHHDIPLRRPTGQRPKRCRHHTEPFSQKYQEIVFRKMKMRVRETCLKKRLNAREAGVACSVGVTFSETPADRPAPAGTSFSRADRA